MLIDFDEIFFKTECQEVLPKGYKAHEDETTFEMSVGDGSVVQKLHMCRVPNNNASVIFYKNDDYDTIQMIMRLDVENSKQKVKYTVGVGHPKTVEKVIENCKLYNAFVKREALMDGDKLNSIFNSQSAGLFSKSDILLWEKVHEVEQELKLHFNPEEATWEDLEFAEVLYQSLIEKNPTRCYREIDSLTVRNIKQETYGSVRKHKGKPVFMEFSRKEKFKFFGVCKELVVLTSLCNAVVEDYQEEDDSVIIKFADESNDKKRFVARILFQTDGDLIVYRSGNLEERIRKTREAKRPIEYM